MNGLDIEIFRPGTHTDNGGHAHVFTEADLRQIATSYDPATYEAPVVVGHPKTDAPAYGWIKSLSYADGVLKATLHKVAPEFADMVKAGHFRSRSAAFYPPDAPNNPTPGALHIRHLGFLGAQPPAVKGLKPLNFSDDKAVVIEFGDGLAAAGLAALDRASGHAENLREALAAVQARLSEAEARNAALLRERRSVQHLNFVENMVNEGRVLPREADGLVAFMDAVDDGAVTEITFSEGDGASRTCSPMEFLKDFFTNRPKVVEFGEIAPAVDDNADDHDATNAEAVERWVSEERAKGRAVTYADAPSRLFTRSR